MADPQTTTSTDMNAARRRGPNEDNGSNTAPETRTFSTPQQLGDESVRAAREISQTAADTARGMGERTRQAARDLSTDWRGAIEPFIGMQIDMNRWIDDFWRQAVGLGGGTSLRTARPLSMPTAAPLLGLPPVDLSETDGAYKLCVELPGLTREDVDLQIRGDALVVSGHKAESKDDAGAAYRISERRFGRFERSMPIPPDVRREGIEAAFKDGLLQITLPKTAEATQTGSRIEIRG
jgi:HSP20 family protein